MANDTIARGGGPENTTYDRNRHESMRLRPLGYGAPKVSFDPEKITACCEACVFSSGIHAAFCEKFLTA